MRKLTILAAVAALLWGCGDSKYFFKAASLNRDDKPSFITDAKQRVVTNIDIVNSSVAGQVLPKQIVCAEPSPDVASAFAEAMRAGISKKDGEKETKGEVSRSTAEHVAALGERLATVQLLRDMAYRNCEAYANGAINATSYTISNSRLNKTIVTLLTSEMMSGAFGRTLPTAGTKASTKSAGKDQTSETIAEALPTNAPPGEIKGRTAVASVDGLNNIHERFIKDDSFVTLVDACVANLNTISVVGSGPDGRVTQNDLHFANQEIAKAPFSKVCLERILPAAVKIAEKARSN